MDSFSMFSQLWTKAARSPNGHFDVVPEGDGEAWSYDVCGNEIVDGRLFGRGRWT